MGVRERERVFSGRYQVVGVLGDGGMARVYKAVDNRLGRVVAVKVLHDHYNKQPAFVARFEQEARLAAGLNHPNIIGVYDIGQDDGDHYIVTEYVEGETLKRLIDREAPVALSEAATILRQLCLALDDAHAHGVIHRDVKPDNIFLTTQRTVKVGDFGIARVLDSTTLTPAGVVMGSVSYFAPEQALGQRPMAPADLYAAGVVLYEMLTRCVPFVADNALAVAMMHLKEAPLPPSMYNHALPPAVDAVVLKALSKDPAHRYPSGRTLADALAAAAGLAGADMVSAGAAAGPAVSIIPLPDAHAPKIVETPVAEQHPPQPPQPATMAVTAPNMIVGAGRPGEARPPARAGRDKGSFGAALSGASARGRAAPPPPHRRRRSLVPLVVPLLGALFVAGVLKVAAGNDTGRTIAGRVAPPQSAPSRRPPVRAGHSAGGPIAAPTNTASSTTTPVQATAAPGLSTVTPRRTAVSRRHHTARHAHRRRRPLPVSTQHVAGGVSGGAGATTSTAPAPAATSSVTSQSIEPASTATSARTHGALTGTTATPTETTLPSATDTASATDRPTRKATNRPTTTPVAPSSTATAPASTATSPAADSNPPADTGSTTTQAWAAITDANDVYMQVMNNRDTSGVDAAFGPDLAATNRGVAANLAAAHEHYQISLVSLTPLGTTVIDANTVRVAATKTETVKKLADSGQVVQGPYTDTETFVNTVQRSGGRWRVTRVDHSSGSTLALVPVAPTLAPAPDTPTPALVPVVPTTSAAQPTAAAPAPTATSAPVNSNPAPDTGSATTQAWAAISYANDVYMQVMNNRDTSGVDAAFGPDLAATNRGVAAGLAAAHEHYQISLVSLTPLGTTVIDANTVRVTATKTETVEKLTDSGQVIQGPYTDTETFVNTVERIGGRWRVTQVSH